MTFEEKLKKLPISRLPISSAISGVCFAVAMILGFLADQIPIEKPLTGVIRLESQIVLLHEATASQKLFILTYSIVGLIFLAVSMFFFAIGIEAKSDKNNPPE